MECVKLLLIGGDVVDILAIRRILEAAGVQPSGIHEVTTGEAGLARLAREAFDCALVDFCLPGTDGLALLRRARAAGCSTPIVMLTGCGDEQLAVDIMKAGAADYIAQNALTPERLATGVWRAVHLRRTEERAQAAREALRASEYRLRLALDAASMGTWDYDPDSDVLRWDERCCAMLGAGDAGDTTLVAAVGSVHPDDRQRVLETWRGATARDDGHFRVEFRNFDGTSWFSAQGRALFNADHRPARCVGTLLDITTRHQAQAQAKHRAAFEKRLLGIVGHDIRSPLSAIVMSADLLLHHTELTERQARIVGRVRAGGARIEQIAALLLDLTRARLGDGIPVEPQPGNLHDIARRVVEEARAGNPEACIELGCEGDGQGAWDAARVAQMLANLLSNALKYGSRGTPVGVLVQRRDAHVVVQVHNHGPPIAAALLPNLFELFWRGPQEDNAAKHSLGLGLFIVRELARSHGGEVSVVSEEGLGTTFSVTLPVHSRSA